MNTYLCLCQTCQSKGLSWMLRAERCHAFVTTTRSCPSRSSTRRLHLPSLLKSTELTQHFSHGLRSSEHFIQITFLWSHEPLTADQQPLMRFPPKIIQSQCYRRLSHRRMCASLLFSCNFLTTMPVTPYAFLWASRDRQDFYHSCFGSATIWVCCTYAILRTIIRRVSRPDNFRERVLELNASDERGIGIVRNKVKNFARQTPRAQKVASDGKSYPCPPYKIIILDEADSMTQDAQGALRRIMETYARITRFCLVCNYVTRLAPFISIFLTCMNIPIGSLSHLRHVVPNFVLHPWMQLPLTPDCPTLRHPNMLMSIPQ